jgi:adenylosuccinate synthase
MKTKKAFVVVGLGFGDEGKGLTTDYLALQHPDAVVIRFNGGQQAGHTVVTGSGKRHVFSNFSSGTFRGNATYWSEFCTFSPGSMLKELSALQKMQIQPRLLIDKLCAVTTHYDVMYNRILEMGRGNNRHGSCGMGFGSTIERHTLSPVRLYAQDLLFPDFTRLKLKTIRDYYRKKLKPETDFDFDSLDHDAEDEKFLQYLPQLKTLTEQDMLRFVTEKEVFQQYNTFIFEGAQGVLLDMDFGFFPHVTRSNTTSKNALELLKRNFGANHPETEIFYASRCYQTRHGQGPMTHEGQPLTLINNELETNQYNEHQGVFRTSPLDIDLLNYALTCDDNFAYGIRKNLMFTCLDQLDSAEIPYYQNNELQAVHYQKITDLLSTKIDNVVYSFSDCGERIGK